ncbi:hypothetical protein ABH926_008535 [Catenulispora sp. GP43]|uniref:DUF6807 domain-containing protein n=1 Tax=Catenulispora sp. GP43 TaxID=3156263 RepID=UPI0035188B45
MTASDAALTAATAVSVNDDQVSVGVSVGAGVEAQAGPVEVLRARFADQAVPARECRTPYLHPLRTLSGGVVTGHRPHDHRWHKGLTMAVPHAAGTNFWGGPSYVDGLGYVDLGDVGRVAAGAFQVLVDDTIAAELAWIGADGVPLLAERRSFAVRDVNPAAGCWTLEFRSELRTLGADPVAFKSPTVLGRDQAGYCGFFWRGPRSFTGGRVLAGNGLEGAEALMGERAPWLAYIGEFDERDGFATLLFIPDGAPPEWFVRSDDYPGVNPSLAFRRPRVLAAGERLAVGYRVVIADGAWSRERIGEFLRGL